VADAKDGKREGPEQAADRIRAHYELEKRLAACLLEAIMGTLPFSLRKAVARRPPMGWLLGIQFVGFRPAA
jgi:hypothetical protein